MPSDDPIFMESSVWTTATINKDKLDPTFVKQIDDMEAMLAKLQKMVYELYYPYRNKHD
jgi:hypothetical protein